MKLDIRQRLVLSNFAPEMNVLIILNTGPHPLDPNSHYAPKPVRLLVKRVPLPTMDDACRRSRPENERGFILTERYFL